MPLLGLFRFGEVFVEVVDVDEGLGEVVALLDGLEPSCFGGGVCRLMEVTDGQLDARKFVDVVDCFRCGRSIVAAYHYVGLHAFARGEGLHSVEGFHPRWDI